MRIYVDGYEREEWSISQDSKHLSEALTRIGADHVRRFWEADIVHNLWWNCLLRFGGFPLRSRKNILVTASNFIDDSDEEFLLRKEFRKMQRQQYAWIAPSEKQLRFFVRNNMKAYYRPFYVDLSIFFPIRDSSDRNELCARFQIPVEKLEGRRVLASFQRDSLGSDLSVPKRQKGPDVLIDILKEMPRERFILLLAGPRRHFILRECQRHNIPYHYIGTETELDDIGLNSIAMVDMPYLYALADLYLITSRIEGGPKSVLEGTACKTPVLSTNVGLAKDFLDDENVFDYIDDYKRRLFTILSSDLASDVLQASVEQQYERVAGVLSESRMDSQLRQMYAQIMR